MTTSAPQRVPPSLRLPAKVWARVLSYELPVLKGSIHYLQLTRMREICRALREIADDIMPLVARKMYPQHANDPRIDDGLFAEALIASHMLNVASPFQVLVARSGGSEAAHGTWLKQTAEETVKGAAANPSEVLPSRKDWIVGSRRMLHDLHAQGRDWPFDLCHECGAGTCNRCHDSSDKLVVKTDAWWYRAPSSLRASSMQPYSNAIFGSDARFCEVCAVDVREWPERPLWPSPCG